MRAPRTITAYLLREVLMYTLLGLAAIIVVLVTRNLVRALEDLVDAGLTFNDLLLVVRLLGTMLVIYALPIAFLFGVMAAIGRMAADVEITAMRACGLGMHNLVLPVLVLGVLLSLVTLRFSLEAEPAARREMRAAVKTVLARGGVIEPGKFRRFGENRLFHVDERDDDGRLSEIMISDRSSPEHPFIVFAKAGTLNIDEERNQLVLELTSGDIHLQPPPGDARYQRIAFERFSYAIDMTGLLDLGRRLKAKEMTMAQLEATLERVAAGGSDELRDAPADYTLNWHRRYAAPFATALFGLVGVPIAMRRTRGARSMGLLWCAVLAFGYYMLQTFSEFLALQGWIPLSAAYWVPNAAFATLGVALLLRVRNSGDA